MLNEEKIVLAHFKKEMYELKKDTSSNRLQYPEDILARLARIEADVVLGFPDDDLPFSEVTE